MLSQKENDLLTQTGPGTPMGELFRRFWLPAALASEIEKDGSPIRLRLLSEDLISFRDSKGNVAIVDAYCRHKLAGLFWGRNEEEGIRCTYHGWKYDKDGNCVDMPNEPADSNFKNKIKLKSYPAREWGGMVWVYMGPIDRMPGLPELEWCHVPEDHRHVSRWLQGTNWCQGLEGEFDNSHVSYLHKWLERDESNNSYLSWITNVFAQDGTPRFFVRETDYGYLTAARRNVPLTSDAVRRTTDAEFSSYSVSDNDDIQAEYFWTMSQWMMPTHSFVGNPGWPQSGRIWVPVDDQHTMTFGVTYNGYEPLNEYLLEGLDAGKAFPPNITRGKFTLTDGYVIDTWIPDANVGNDFNIDREMQKKTNFTGLYGLNDQDRSIQEAMRSAEGLPTGTIVDRTKEHLGTADVPTIALRRRMIRAARDLQNGIEPTLAAHPELYMTRSPRVRSSVIGDFNELYEKELSTDIVAEV
jgi:phthalate 4,5-dioxygenase oxygenase subunit